MADDLRQEELCAEGRRCQKIDLTVRIGVRIRPAAQRDRVIPLSQHLPELPRVLDAARGADPLIAAENDKRRKPALVGSLGVRETVRHRMLCRQERDDPLARNISAEIDDQVAEVVFFLRADGAVGEEDERARPCQSLHGVIGIDPGVHAFVGGQLGPRRTQLRREDRRSRAECGEQVHRFAIRQRALYTMRRVTPAALRAALARVPSIPLAPDPSPVEPLPRLRAFLRGGPQLFVKRDDAIPFGFGGNKIRKLAFVAARARAEGADTLITAGGVQSNHARATAAAAAKLGMQAILVANGSAPAAPTANALLDALLGANVVYVDSREARTPAMERVADRVRAEGRRPFVIPIGASTPLGALGFVGAVAELVDQIPAPDVIIHSSSSGGTQAGLVAGCRLLGLPTRVIGVSADDPVSRIEERVRSIVGGIGSLLDLGDELSHEMTIEIDDHFVGGGYGIQTAESREAIEVAARTEALFLDPTYTAKAMAALIAYVRQGRFRAEQTILFWHTGGQVALFA